MASFTDNEYVGMSKDGVNTTRETDLREVSVTDDRFRIEGSGSGLFYKTGECWFTIDKERYRGISWKWWTT